MTAHKPATPLPWSVFCHSDARTGTHVRGGQKHDGAEFPPSVCKRTSTGKLDDVEYIAHACNAYPRLVGFVKACALGADDYTARALLRSLGEAE